MTYTKETAVSTKLLWASKLSNEPRLMNGLTAAVTKEWVIIPKNQGTMIEIIIVGGSSNHLFALNAENGQLLWQRDFETKADKSKVPFYVLCPQSLNATPVIEDRGWPDGNQLIVVYAISSDGRLHGLNLASGKNIFEPRQFVPSFSKNWSLNLFDGWLYTATSQGCGNDEPAVYAINTKNLEDAPKVFPAKRGIGGGIWGRAGVAISENGTVFTEVGDGIWNPKLQRFADSVIALDHKSLELRDYFTPRNREWITRKDLDMSSTSPVVFPFKKWQLVAASGKEGVIYLLDANNLGGLSHRTPLFRSPTYSNEAVAFSSHGVWGAISTWEDEKEERWLYLPAWGPIAESAPKFEKTNGSVTSGAIMAFTIAENEKTNIPILMPRWTSLNMHVPEPTVIANGVVFALANGANVGQVTPDGKFRQDRHETPFGNAILYALDAQTGQVLWSSGDAIKDWTHFSGLAVFNGKVIVTTRNGHVYAFGIDLKNQ